MHSWYGTSPCLGFRLCLSLKYIDWPSPHSCYSLNNQRSVLHTQLSCNLDLLSRQQGERINDTSMGLSHTDTRNTRPGPSLWSRDCVTTDRSDKTRTGFQKSISRWAFLSKHGIFMMVNVMCSLRPQCRGAYAPLGHIGRPSWEGPWIGSE